MSEKWIEVMCAEADHDGKIGEARVVLMAETVDWAAHVSAAMYHMNRIKCGDVAMIDGSALHKLCDYIDSNAEVLMRSTDRHTLHLMTSILEMLNASMRYRPRELFRSDDGHRNKLRPVDGTHCSPDDWLTTMERQARNLAERDRQREEEG